MRARGKGLVVCLLSLVGLVSLQSDSGAVIWLDWAGEFIGGRASMYVTGSTGTFYVHHQWDNDAAGEPPRWGYVGHQGASAAGKANAQEKIMTYWYEASPYAYGATINLARRRVTPPPSSGAGCTSGTQTFVGSVSYTKDSSVFAPADWDVSMRLKPVYNFTQETAGAGTNVGYRSTITSTSLTPNMESVNVYGCYRIDWI